MLDYLIINHLVTNLIKLLGVFKRLDSKTLSRF